MPHAHRAFTLVELLVVITIILVLISLITPALDKAIYQAEKVDCLSRQKNLVSACLIYSMDHKRYFPPNSLPGVGSASAYDIRMWLDENGVPTAYAVNPGAGAGPATPYLQLGLVPGAGYLPKDRLGKVMHCPVMDNTGNPHSSFGTGAGRYALVGMDRVSDFGVGASWYTDASTSALRMIIGYHYRGTSYENSDKGKLRQAVLTSDDLITVDMPDQRFTGLSFGPGTITAGVNDADMRAFMHPDGYGLSFADGHAAFRDDRKWKVAWAIFNGTGGWGDMSAHQPHQPAAKMVENIYTGIMVHGD